MSKIIEKNKFTTRSSPRTSVEIMCMLSNPMYPTPSTYPLPKVPQQ